MTASSCDYYKAYRKDNINCPNCRHWAGVRCGIEDKVKNNSKTDLVHERLPAAGRSRRVTGLLK